MWSDNETNEDFIDYRHLVAAVKSIVDNDRLLPCSLGIFGDWGSGKSSLMKMVADTYKNEGNEDILIVSFNGWLFEDYEDAKTVLMGRVVDEIIKKRTLAAKSLKIASRLLKKIDIMKLSGSAIRYGVGFATMGPAGLALASASEALTKLKDVDYEKYLKEKQENKDGEDSLRNNIQEFHANFEELIKETKIKKIIVFIDDLDRCSPDTVIGTLEAIKLFLFTRSTAFIIGADERLIKYAVRRRFPEILGDNAEVGRDYLEKLIQFPIRIPPLNNAELATYVNLLFTNLYIDAGEFGVMREQVLKKRNENQFDFVYGLHNVDEFVKKVNEPLKVGLSICAQIAPVLGVGLNGNPRQSKRFLNTLLLRVTMAKSKGQDLNVRVLSKLMLLEYFKSETFKNFYQSQAENNGIIKNIDTMETLAASRGSESDKGNERNAAKLTSEQQAYLQDDWLGAWLISEPSLKGQNLQPYFYFSRDKLSVTGVNLQRMSPQAQEIFEKLLNDAEVIRASALKEVTGINVADASGIFEALTEKITQQDNHSGESPLLKRLIEFCEKRPELISQLIAYCDKLPEQSLPIGIITWLVSTTESGPYHPSAMAIIEKWSKSTSNKTLANVCKEKLKQIK